MKLVIAEKPSVARDIAAVLQANKRQDGFLEGNGYVVTWCVGHLVQLAPPEQYHPSYRHWSLKTLPILPETFQYQILPTTQKQFSIVQQLISQSEEIVCATDAGREGQLIFEYVLHLSHPPVNCKILRLWISSMTEEAIRDGFSSLKENDTYQRLYFSARCRSEADWLVGINFTRLFTLRYGMKLPVGRVQTPTLALLVARQQSITAFQPTPYYQLQGHFGALQALWHRKNINRFEKKEQAIQLQKKLHGTQGTICKLETRQKTEDRPLLFDLTELQRECNQRFGYTAQETLTIAQRLYETHKLITYPRTDSRYLTSDMKPLIPSLLKKIAQVWPESVPFVQTIISKKLPLDARIFQDKKVSDHHALLVTNKIHQYQPQKLTQKENNILRLIMARFLTILSEKKSYNETKLEIAMDTKEDWFQTTIRIPQKDGWAIVEKSLLRSITSPNKKSKEIDCEIFSASLLAKLSLHQRLSLEKVDLLEKETTPPKPYTEATLLSAMEHANKEIDNTTLKESLKGKGLGTPATRANIIEKLISSGYVERKKKQLFPTEQGMTFIELAPSSICQIEMTAQWELQLQEICDGHGNPSQFMEEIRNYVSQVVATEQAAKFPAAVHRKGKLRRVVGICPKCGCPVIECETSFYCDGFRQSQKCNFTLWKNNKFLQARGVELTADRAMELLSKGAMRINHLISKTGHSYDAIFYLESGKSYTSYHMEFAPKQIDSTQTDESII